MPSFVDRLFLPTKRHPISSFDTGLGIAKSRPTIPGHIAAIKRETKEVRQLPHGITCAPTHFRALDVVIVEAGRS